MKYPDTVIIVDPVVDEYGNEKIGRQETVRALVGQVTGYAQSGSQADISSGSIAYLSPIDTFVLEKKERLEGMLLITSFGEASTDAWYRIVAVNVGKRGLLDNTLDNVQVDLTKTTAILGVS